MKMIRSVLVSVAVVAAAGQAQAQAQTPPPAAPAKTAPQSQASSENRALAETLFFTARGLMEAGRYPEACRKLGESYRLDAASGTLLNLALCHEKEGKIASAWGEYRQALVEARRAGRKDREDICTERIAELEPQVPQLQIDVPPEVRVRGLVVSRNGTQLSSASWGTPLPTDAGQVELIASAPGYKPRKSYVTVAPMAKMSTTIEALAIDDTPPPVTVVRNPGWPTLKTVGFVGMVAGVVGLGLGTAFGIVALGEKKTSDDRCPVRDDEPRCSESGAAAMSRANGFAWGSNIGLAVGGVALVGGGVLFFTSKTSTRRASITPTLGGGRLDVTF